ncbi:MAG: hypothetical protein GX963_06245 [Bacteroidales bacterium]|nr:hypothetical protein [Bacteroidales bacterium]
MIYGPRRSYDFDPQGLISEDNVNLLNEEYLRKQVVSYETPLLIDTLNSIYIIPVSIKTLKKPEEVVAVNEQHLDLLDVSFNARRLKKSSYYNYRQFDGNYANIIIYNAMQDRTFSLFNERIIIGNVEAYYFQDDILMVFYTASKDTDKNGVIDLSDLRSLCIYSLNTGEMRVITDEENQIMHYGFIENSKNLLVEFKLKDYKESQFASIGSPRKIMKYAFDTKKLRNVIPDDIQKEMQKLVEGK